MTTLSTDRRGTILIIAIPMAAIIVGCLWYLVSVGDATLYRERLQDAADATAWQSAVLHAQGMNAVAAVHGASHALLALGAGVRALSVLAVAGQASFGSGESLVAAMADTQAQVSPRIRDALQILAETQRAVATATPVLASVRASVDNTRFYRREHAAQATLAFSYDVLPTRVDTQLAADAQHPGRLLERPTLEQPTRTAGANESSLPLQAATLDPGCAHGGGLGSDELMALAPRLLTRQPLLAAARGLAERLQQEPIASAYCADRLAPSEVWSQAQNGNVMLQTYGMAMGDTPVRQASNQRGMALATAAHGVDIHAERSAFAQAEYYFACSGPWSKCADDAALLPRWTARMRRFVRPDRLEDPSAGPKLARRFEAALIHQRALDCDVTAYLAAFFSPTSHAWIH